VRQFLAKWAGLLLGLAAISLSAGEPAAHAYRVTESLEIDQVPSWFPVRFCLLTRSPWQYVAYYDDQHQMIVAQRRLDQPAWHKVELPSKVGWDSHNYVTLAVDTAGQLHVSGNMHCVPLIYFRTEEAGDITTLKRHRMTGQDEQRCTYPRFLTDADNNLLFTYRSGSSGNGSNFCNRYDPATKTWRRFLDGPLFDGEDQRNAYPMGPTRGPDGRFHVVWVWRDTPDCATNHHLCYARSRDLQRWETARGEPLRLPLTLSQHTSYVDPVPSGGGIINGCERLTFDSQQRPVIAYHKRDANSYMQIYVARLEEDHWVSHPVTAWDRKIDFAGGGAMPFIGIGLSGFGQAGPNRLAIGYRHRDYGSGNILLDERTLRPLSEPCNAPGDYPEELLTPTVDFPGISVRTAEDLGESGDSSTAFLLRWETLDANRDRPRQPPLPPPSRLTLVKLQQSP